MTPLIEPPAVEAVSQDSSRIPAPRYAWKRNPVFKFFSSVRLAVLLIAVLSIACIAGTLWESSFDAKVARAYVYEAWWFNVWLLLLAANLACAAFSRWPWKRKHVGFLITHLGIIVLLAGALIGKIGGIEGTMTLFRHKEPNNRLVIDQPELLVQEGQNALQAFPLTILKRKPSEEKPWNLGKTPSGWKIELTGYAEALKPVFQPRKSETSQTPAIHLLLESPRLGQKMSHWLMPDDPEHSTVDLAIASIELRSGVLPVKAPLEPTNSSETPKPEPVEEAIVVFANKPGEQVAQALAGSPTGTRVTLEVQAEKRLVKVEHSSAKWSFDLDQFQGKEVELGSSGLRMMFEAYWPDFEMADGAPRSKSDQPLNPAVLVRVRGNQIPPESAAPGAPATSKDLKLGLFLQDGKINYELLAGKPEPMRGELLLGQPLSTGWADWQVTWTELRPGAVPYTEFQPLEKMPTGPQKKNLLHGVKVRLSKGSEVHEEWAPSGWEVSIPAGDNRVIRMGYGPKVVALPIGIQLEKFTVERNEGTDSPASFKSDLLVQDLEGNSARGSCYMNHPMNFPDTWWRAWTGLTFKISQASWNPDNLDQSSVQILMDPGWLFKWLGSLLICVGIYILFYLRPHPQFKQTTSR